MKKNLKRILALWLVLAFAVIGIVGCASEVPEETTDSSATETTKTTGTATEGSETTKATETTKITETETTPTGTTPTGTAETTGTTGTVKPAETTSSSAETTGTTTPGIPEKEEDVHILRLVYLGTDAVTLFEADLTGTSFLVKTDRPACAMDGTEFMPIYYRYDTTSETYTEKLTQNTLYTDITPGHFYLTEEDGEIVRELPALLGYTAESKKNVYADSFFYDYEYTRPVYDGKGLADGSIFRLATVTSVSEGKIMARLGTDEKETDITDWNVKFIYSDVDGIALHMAGENTQVAVSTFDNMVSALDTLYDNVAKAKIMYETYRDGRVVDGKTVTYPADTVAYYENLYEQAKAELETAKENALNQKMNGAFWGQGSAETSPLGAYFSKVKLSFGKDASLSFVYFTVDDVHYVLATTFALE